MRIFCFLTIAFSSLNLLSQNLVKNPSFEEITDCANEISLFNRKVKDWDTPTGGTTDLFNRCSTEEDTAVPENYKGNQLPYHGDNYVGMFVLGNPGLGSSYREYIQGELIEKLIANHHYELSFMVCLAEDSDMVIKNLGILFTNEKLNGWNAEPIKFKKKPVKEHVAQFIDLKQSQYIAHPDRWLRIDTTIIATGKERFFQIGNFDSNSKTTQQPKKRRARKKKCYLYIDMISITKLESDNFSTVESNDKNSTSIIENSSVETGYYELNTDFQIENLQFYFDSDKIIPESTEKLREITSLLLNSLELSIHITGHTDQQGSDEYNLKLSNLRAYAVRNYLIQNGVASNRITYHGLGEEQLLDSLDSEKAHATNRRVTFSLSKG